MSDGTFENIEITREGTDFSPSEAFDLFHNPGLAYNVIRNNVAKLQDGTSIEMDNVNIERKVISRSKVNVFQLIMQYVESFGIYLLSYLRGRENFINDLIATRPSNIKEFFKHLKEGTEDEYFAEQDAEKNYRELLEYWLGYHFLDQKDEGLRESIDWNKFSADSIDELIDNSIDAFDNDIRQIGEFYLYFDKVYNAVKHGDRVFTGAESAINVNSDGEKIETFENMDFISFICKEDGTPLIVILPVEKLLEDSLTILEKTHRLFTHIKQVSKSLIRDEGEENLEMEVSFIQYTSDEDDDTEWVQGTTNNVIVLLPKIGGLKEATTNRPSGTFAGRIEIEEDTLIIRTERDREISPDYPIEVTLGFEGPEGLSSTLQGSINFSFDASELNVSDFYEMLKIQRQRDGEGIRSVRIVDEENNRETELKPPIEGSALEGLSIQSFIDEDYIEFLSRLERITGRQIPVPQSLSEEQEEIIKEWIDRGTSNLTQDEVKEIIDELEELGRDRIFTEIWIERITPEDKVLEREQIGLFPGSISLEISPESLGGEGTSRRIKTGEQIDFKAKIRGYSPTYHELINRFRESPDEIGDIINEILEIIKSQLETETGEEPVTHQLLYNFEEYGFWSTINQLRLKVIE